MVNINIILLLYLQDKPLKANNKYVQPHIIILKLKRFGHSCDHNQAVIKRTPWLWSQEWPKQVGEK